MFSCITTLTLLPTQGSWASFIAVHFNTADLGSLLDFNPWTDKFHLFGTRIIHEDRTIFQTLFHVPFDQITKYPKTILTASRCMRIIKKKCKNWCVFALYCDSTRDIQQWRLQWHLPWCMMRWCSCPRMRHLLKVVWLATRHLQSGRWHKLMVMMEVNSSFSNKLHNWKSEWFSIWVFINAWPSTNAIINKFRFMNFARCAVTCARGWIHRCT